MSLTSKNHKADLPYLSGSNPLRGSTMSIDDRRYMISRKRTNANYNRERGYMTEQPQ